LSKNSVILLVKKYILFTWIYLQVSPEPEKPLLELLKATNLLLTEIGMATKKTTGVLIQPGFESKFLIHTKVGQK